MVAPKKRKSILSSAKAQLLKTLPEIPKEEMKIPSFPYKNLEGSFGVITRKGDKITNVNWEGCRDRFQQTSEPEYVMDFLFCHKAKAADNVINFLHAVEVILGLPPEDRLEIRKTGSSTILYIKMSKWWKYKMRRSLLTALCRCGQFFTENSAAGFEKALFSQYYTSQTKPAIAQFLKGRTGAKLKKGGFNGWYAHFVNKDESAVRKTLVGKKKPESPATEGNLPDVAPTINITPPTGLNFTIS